MSFSLTSVQHLLSACSTNRHFQACTFLAAFISYHALFSWSTHNSGTVILHGLLVALLFGVGGLCMYVCMYVCMYRWMDVNAGCKWWVGSNPLRDLFLFRSGYRSGSQLSKIILNNMYTLRNVSYTYYFILGLGWFYIILLSWLPDQYPLPSFFHTKMPLSGRLRAGILVEGRLNRAASRENRTSELSVSAWIYLNSREPILRLYRHISISISISII